MESSFWNLFPHFHSHYYQIYTPKDLHQDYKSGNAEWDDYRDAYSVVIDLDRFEYIIRDILRFSDNDDQRAGGELYLSESHWVFRFLGAVLLCCGIFWVGKKIWLRFTRNGGNGILGEFKRARYVRSRSRID